MDMITFLKSNGIPVYQSGEGKRDKHISSDRAWYQMVCPICGTDHLWLGYNAEKDFFNCFNHGHVTKYELFRTWFPHQNLRELFDQIDVVFDGVVEIQRPVGVYEPPKPVMNLLDFKRHCQYVRGRGLDPEEMSRVWGWGAIPINGEYFYRDRLFFPVFNRDGVAVSWQTRTILKNEPNRYLTAPKKREVVPIKTLLYGEHLVNPFKTVIVCEGVFDAVAIGPNAVATLGKSLTREQKMKIAKYPRRIICFDSEDDTQQQARDLAGWLSLYSGVTDTVCLDAPDPATAPRKEIDSLLRYAELV